jgi:8-oxo-dGTP diphosphatase
MEGEDMSTIGVFAIIFDEHERVLLAHRHDLDRWNLPGGRVEGGETPWDALKREVQEEVGITISINELTGLYAYPSADDLILQFLCSWMGGSLSLSDEADAIQFYALDALPVTLHEHHRIRIFDAAHFHGTICYKTLPRLPMTEFGLVE